MAPTVSPKWDQRRASRPDRVIHLQIMYNSYNRVELIYLYTRAYNLYGCKTDVFQMYGLCSGSEAASFLRLIDFVYQSTLSLRVIKKKKSLRVEVQRSGLGLWSGVWELGEQHRALLRAGVRLRA